MLLARRLPQLAAGRAALLGRHFSTAAMPEFAYEDLYQSTGPLPSTEAYLAHPILDGIYDDRTGSVCFWFAVAHAQNPNRA